MPERTVWRWRPAAAVATAIIATLLAFGVPAVGAEKSPPGDEPTTTGPATTVPPEEGTDAPATTVADPTTSTVVGPSPTEAPSTTAGGPADTTTTTGGGEATTTTRPPMPPGPDSACMGGFDWSYRFVIDETIEEGESFDDPHSDFSVTFTKIEVVDDLMWVTFEGTHSVGEVVFGGLYFWTGIPLAYEPTNPPALTQTVPLRAEFGRSILWAAFCFSSLEDIGIDPPATEPPATTPNPVEGEVPVTATVMAPVEEAGGLSDDGTLPKTGSDAVPVALAGAGLVAVGGGLLLGRRLRRSAA